MDFISSKPITLSPGTSGYPVEFVFSFADASGNHGSLPHGCTISSATITATAFGGGDISAAAVGAVSVDVDGGTVRTILNHVPAAKKGECRVLLALHLSSGAIITKRWDGLVMG